MKEVQTIVTVGLKGAACLALLSLVCAVSPELPAAETVGQWLAFDKGALVAAGCMILAILVSKEDVDFSVIVSWALMILGSVEAVWGLRQLYGFTASGHSLYALTGSFFNPGPYSGYLAMILPVCLHQYLAYGNKEKVKSSLAGGVMLLLLCVLPAGMSRSAWLAGGFSCLWVYACHSGWGDKLKDLWVNNRKRVLIAATGGLCILILTGWLLFTLKPDSARGRLFMWKISCLAVAEQPLTGHGIGSFAAAYGNAQEAYFAAGNYELWEERVAGSPEYAFNEYLQKAVELGIPLAVCLLATVLFCLYVGIRRKRWGICGAIISLMIFSFSSYPLQLPVFVVTAVCLLLACVLRGDYREWLGMAILIGIVGGCRLKQDLNTEQACAEWMNAKYFYNAGAYEQAEKEYKRLYPLLKNRAAFLFEYGHTLHKQQKAESSNRILTEATSYSSDPMILNVIGKNCQQTGNYLAAEEWLIRSTHRLPGRIYPYYLLVKLYAEPGFLQPDKLSEMQQLVLTKEPKVHSTAIEEMRMEVKKMRK